MENYLNQKPLKKTIHFLLILVAMIYTKPSESQIRIGVFADVQYADSPASGTRYYKNSLFKLNECIEILNRVKGLSFVAG